MIKLKLKLIVEKKLSIGSGGISPKFKADITLPSIEGIDGQERIYIPGSTIKGVLRTSLMRIAWLLGHEQPSGKGDIVTTLFGEPHSPLPSKVYVDSAFIKASTEVLPHVKINDKSGTAEERALFRIEYIPIGEEITTTLIARDLSVDEVKALLAAILNLRYERIGRAGVVNVRIVEAEGLDKFLADPVVNEIYGSLKGG